MAGAPISISAALGYLFGLIVSYMILTRIGINEERNKQLQKRTIFAATGLFGVFITYSSALITSTYLSANPIVVKLFSVALSFIAVYILRAKYVFY
jgi:putative flippase GtrA